MVYESRHGVYAGHIRAALESPFWESDPGISLLRILPMNQMVDLIEALVPMAELYDGVPTDEIIDPEPNQQVFTAPATAIVALMTTPFMRTALSCHQVSLGWYTAGSTHPPGWSPPGDDNDLSPAELAAAFIAEQAASGHSASDAGTLVTDEPDTDVAVDPPSGGKTGGRRS